MQTKPVDLAQFVELHKLIGLALWHSQALEDALARFITLILKLPASRAEAEVLEVLENLQSRTLGALIAELRKGNTTKSVSEFERRMNRFLGERNWLVHSSWREHHADLYTPARLPPLFCRLDALATEAHALQGFFAELLRSWTLHQPGISEEDLRAAHQQILRDRGVID